MNNDQTIDGVPRELLELAYLALVDTFSWAGDLRALLDAPTPYEDGLITSGQDNYLGLKTEPITVLEAWDAIGHDIGCNPSKDELLDSLRNMAAICDAHGNDFPSAQTRGESVAFTAVGVLRKDGDGGLAPEWILEGGTAELWEGAVLLIADEDQELCAKDGHCELYREQPASAAVRLPTQHDFEQLIIERDGAVWVSVLGDHRDYNQPINRDYATWNACLAVLKHLNPSFFMVSRLEAA